MELDKYVQSYGTYGRRRKTKINVEINMEMEEEWSDPLEEEVDPFVIPPRPDLIDLLRFKSNPDSGFESDPDRKRKGRSF